MRGRGPVIGVGVWVVENLGFGDFRVHARAPGLLADFGAQIVDRRLRRTTSAGQVDADQAVVAFHDPAVDQDRVDIGPLGVQDIATRTGLHPNTARFHLDGLVDDGYAERATEDRDQPGRPRAVYRAVAGHAAAGRRSYRLLAEILTTLVADRVPQPERLARVQSLCDDVMSRIGALVPVTPVPLACAAIQSFDRDFIPRRELLERMSEMRDTLLELNGRVIRHERDIEETFERAWRMLRMRRVLAETGDGFAVLPKSRELVSYYANSVAHLLGPFEQSVRRRDSLPATTAAAIT